MVSNLFNTLCAIVILFANHTIFRLFIYQIQKISMERTLQRKSYNVSFVVFIVHVSTEPYILASLTETMVLDHLGI